MEYKIIRIKANKRLYNLGIIAIDVEDDGISYKECLSSEYAGMVVLATPNHTYYILSKEEYNKLWIEWREVKVIKCD